MFLSFSLIVPQLSASGHLLNVYSYKAVTNQSPDGGEFD